MFGKRESDQLSKLTKAYFRKALKKAKQEHDMEYVNIDMEMEFMKRFPRTNDIPFFPDENTIEIEKIRSLELKRLSSHITNFMPQGMVWHGHDLMFRLDGLLRRRIQKLCRGTVSRDQIRSGPERIQKFHRVLLMHGRNSLLSDKTYS